MKREVVFKSFFLALLISLMTARPALAYIDPNTGGMLFQVLAAGFGIISTVALIFSRQIRVGFAKARRFVRDAFNRDQEVEE